MKSDPVAGGKSVNPTHPPSGRYGGESVLDRQRRTQERTPEPPSLGATGEKDDQAGSS